MPGNRPNDRSALARLEAAAREAFAALGGDPGAGFSLRAVQRVGGRRVRIELAAGTAENGAARVPAGEHLTPLERHILQASTHRPQSAKQLAGAVARTTRRPRTCNGYFWGVLRGLVQRHLLVKEIDGYRLPDPS